MDLWMCVGGGGRPLLGFRPQTHGHFNSTAPPTIPLHPPVTTHTHRHRMTPSRGSNSSSGRRRRRRRQASLLCLVGGLLQTASGFLLPSSSSSGPCLFNHQQQQQQLPFHPRTTSTAAAAAAKGQDDTGNRSPVVAVIGHPGSGQSTFARYAPERAIHPPTHSLHQPHIAPHTHPTQHARRRAQRPAPQRLVGRRVVERGPGPRPEREGAGLDASSHDPSGGGPHCPGRKGGGRCVCGWVDGLDRKLEEKEAVQMSCCGRCMDVWVGCYGRRGA